MLGVGSLAAALTGAWIASLWAERLEAGSHLALGQAGNASSPRRRLQGRKEAGVRVAFSSVRTLVAPEQAGVDLKSHRKTGISSHDS